MKQQVFEYLIIWHPNAEQAKDGAKSKFIVVLQRILAKDLEAAKLAAAMSIPVDFKEELDQIQIAVRPF